MGTPNGFDLPAFHAAVEAERQAQGLTRAQLGQAVGVSPSTIARMARADDAEADGVLALGRWLDLAPESFVPGHAPVTVDKGRPGNGMLRTDLPAIHAALDAARTTIGMTWADIVGAIGDPAVTAASLRGLAKRSRTTIRVLVAASEWLGRPTTDFTRLSPW